MILERQHFVQSCRIFVQIVFALVALALPAHAEHIKVGVLRTTSSGPLYIGVDKGFFAAEGLDVEIVFFDSPQPVAVATVSGDLDIGATGLAAGFYALANQGALRIVAAQGREAPGFHNLGYFVSNRAYEAGLHTIRDLAGKTVAVSQIGAPGHYALGVIGEKYGVSLSSMRVLAMQSIANITSALTGGQADAGVTGATVPTMAAVDRGDLKLIAWVGDELSFQDRAIFVTTKTANERRDMIERFLRGYQKSAQLYHDAFTGPGEKPQDGPTAPEMIAIIGKYVNQPPAAVKLGIAYIDPSLRVNVGDIYNQIAWYKKQGMLKPEVSGADIIDKRYVVPLPQ